MKVKKSLKTNILIKAFCLSIAIFWLLTFATTRNVYKYNRAMMKNQAEQSLNELLYVVANVNSVLMQQMRMYTKFDEICAKPKNSIEVQKELSKIASSRYKDFETIGWVSYKEDKIYWDSGVIENAKDYVFYDKLLNNRKVKKADQMYTDVLPNRNYGIVKEVDFFGEDGKPVGAYMGVASIEKYLQRFISKIKGTQLIDPRGFPLIVNKNLNIICAPEYESLSKLRCVPSAGFEVEDTILNFIKDPKEKDEQGNKITIAGNLSILKRQYFASVGVFPKTEWTILIAIPYTTIDESAYNLIKLSTILSIIFSCLMVGGLYTIISRSLNPLGKLEEQFREIAEGNADLNARLPENGIAEIKQIQLSFNMFNQQLKNIIKEIGKTDKEIEDLVLQASIILSRMSDEYKVLEFITEAICAGDSSKVDLLDKSMVSLEFLLKDLRLKVSSIYNPASKLARAVEGFEV